MISADFQQQGPYPVTHAEGFPRDQVFTGQQRFGVTTEIYNNVVPCHLLDGAGYQLTDAITVAVDNLHALGFAHLLEDDLLGGLSTDTPECHRFHLLFVHVARPEIGVNLFGFLHGQLGVQCRNRIVVYHQPAAEGLVFAGTAIDSNPDVGFFVFVTFLAAVASASSIASKITSFSTPFSFETDSTTSKISLLIGLPCPQNNRYIYRFV